MQWREKSQVQASSMQQENKRHLTKQAKCTDKTLLHLAFPQVETGNKNRTWPMYRRDKVGVGNHTVSSKLIRELNMRSSTAV